MKKFNITLKDPVLLQTNVVVVYANSQQEALEKVNKPFHTVIGIKETDATETESDNC